MKQGNKRLVICCDGTWNEPLEKVEDPADETEPTNVLKVVRGVAPTDQKGFPQIVYYDAGVGTEGWFDKVVGGAFGKGLSQNVKQAYRFIANNYTEGDELFLFGFSRGAYTVRSLAGFIGAVGLLPKKHLRRVPDAYALYRIPPSNRAESKPRKYLEGLCPKPRQSIPIKFIGVWDTVGALGVPTPGLRRITKRWVRFHDTQLGPNVRHAYHALAIDERRRPFQPNLWTDPPKPRQTIEQVWFCGVHSNVGGGYRDTGLSDITLAWMVARARSHGLEFSTTFATPPKRPAQSGRLEDSFSMGYHALRLLRIPPHRREIGPCQHGDIRKSDKEVPGESVHPSAAAAIGEAFRGNPGKPPYNPANLENALESGLTKWRTPLGATGDPVDRE